MTLKDLLVPLCLLKLYTIFYVIQNWNDGTYVLVSESAFVSNRYERMITNGEARSY
jgi:hypothetical protein